MKEEDKYNKRYLSHMYLDGEAHASENCPVLPRLAAGKKNCQFELTTYAPAT